MNRPFWPDVVRGRAASRPRRPPPAPPPRPPCLLQSLADPLYGGVLPGFVFVGDRIQLDTAAFGCCGATGVRLDDADDVTQRCELTARLGSVRRLLRQFDQAALPTGRSLLRELDAPETELREGLRRLADLRAGRSRQGLAHCREAAAPRRLSLWALAFTAAWRFGFEPHVVTLETTLVDGLVPRPLGGGRGGHRPPLIFVENAARLWEAQVSDHFEYVVGYAYNALTPLFVELVLPPGMSLDAAGVGGASAGAPPRNTRLALSRRIDRIKGKSPLAWLRPDCRSKLASVTSGLQAWLPPATRGSAPGTSGMPKLPWDP